MSASTSSSLVPLPGDGLAMRQFAESLVGQARTDGIELTGDGGLLTMLIRQVLQASLNAEMTEHLGYEPHAVEGRGSGNSRNGSYPKTVMTEIGQVDIDVPRDRNGTFEPVIVPKGWASSNGRCTVPVMMAGAVDPHRPLEIPGCQACRCRCLNARRSVPR